jgi:glycine cleavage system aminomethyltransferase T
MTESRNTTPRRRKRKRKNPVGASKYAAFTGAAGGAITGAIVSRIADRTATAVENGVAKAAEKHHFSRKSENSWEQAAQNVN